MSIEQSGYIDPTKVSYGVCNGFGACVRAVLDKPSFTEDGPGVVRGISVGVRCPNPDGECLPDENGNTRRALAMNGGDKPLVDAAVEGIPLRAARPRACLLARSAFVNANCGNCPKNPASAEKSE